MSDFTSNEAEFVSGAANALAATALEFDKSILTLSAGAIGLLVTLLSTTGVASQGLLNLYISALLAFLCCIVGLLFVFKLNEKFIVEVVGNPEATKSKALIFFDRLVLVMFGVGIVLASAIGVGVGQSSLIKEKEKIMAKQPGEAKAMQDVLNNAGPVRKSLNAYVDLQNALKTRQAASNASASQQEPRGSSATVSPSPTAPSLPQQGGNSDAEKKQ